jgi:hypothetical protein
MKRLYIAAVAGLCAVGSAGAQDGGLAPTAPVVPAPVLQHGGPADGRRPFTSGAWSPVRSPVVPGANFAGPAAWWSARAARPGAPRPAATGRAGSG